MPASGGIESVSGGIKYHTFYGDGTLTVTGDPIDSAILIVGGGGAGGSQHGAGGGGGRVVAYGTSLAPGSYPVVVGAGGLPTRDAPGDGSNGLPGGSSSFNGQTAEGGGGGGSYQKLTVASVGPGGGGSAGPSQAGGVSSLSNNGGAGDNGTQNAGGGGGAGPGAVGGAGNGSDAGDGGNGYLWIDGEYYGGGGGGGGVSEAASGEGGLGGGGQGTYSVPGGNGVAGKGGGGGGTRDLPTTIDGGTGGSGVVIISYPIAVNTTPPSISGAPEEGATITATPGDWEGGEPVTGQWQYSDNNDLTTWIDITSQVATQIRVPYETTGFYVRYQEVSGGVIAVSNVIGPIAEGPPPKWVRISDPPGATPTNPLWVPLEPLSVAPPANPLWVPLSGPYPVLAVVSPVSFTGAVNPGETLTRVPAVWSRAETVLVEWLLDGSVVATGTNTYLVPDQVGSTVTLRETATGTGKTLTSEYSQIIVVGNIGTRQISWPRERGNVVGAPHICWLKNVDVDDWSQGAVVNNELVIPKDGTYELYAYVNWPEVSSPGVGWGNGWSGEGGGAAWLRVYRGGSLVIDNLFRDDAWEGTGNQNFYNYCGPGNQALLAGDVVQVWGDAGATGLDAVQWECLLRAVDLA